MTSHTLPDDPVYAFCPAYDFDNMPQQIRIVFADIPGYIPTALVGLTLDDAERICDRLNAKLGLDRNAWSAIACRAMFDTLPPHSTTGYFETMAGARSDPGGFLPEARTGAREAAAHMKDLAERFAELRNAIMRLPNNPSCDDRAGLRHRLLHLENTLMCAMGSLDDVIIAIMDANDAAR